MKLIIFALLVTSLALSGCSLPQGESTARVCIQDSGICYFPDDPNAPSNPYSR